MTMQQSLIRSWLDDLVGTFSQSPISQMNCFRQFIVTGSYADWLKNPDGVSAPSWNALPDINLYVLVSGSEEEQIVAEYELGLLYKQMMEKNKEINLLLDLHPFSRSVGTIVLDRLNLQLTSRIINMKDISKYPDYCWYGWKSNYFVLYLKGEDALEKLDVSSPKRDLAWLKHMHMAFASYSNVMHMIALSSISVDSLEIFDEAYRYCKEVMKDGISLGIPISAEENFNYSVIKKWKDKSDTFYGEYYGSHERSIVEHILMIEKDYFSYRTSEQAKHLLTDFFTLKNFVYEKGFKARMLEIQKMQNDTLVSLPLWY
jgi:hypothetical protein